nr:hypothetical protein [Tanacetum cinerariifolium]
MGGSYSRFLAQLFPPGRTTKLRNNILIFQHEESLSESQDEPLTNRPVQSETTNKISTVLKAITDQLVGMFLNDMVKNLNLGATLVLSARSYLTIDPQCSSHPSNSINAIKEVTISQTSLQQPEIEIEPLQPKEPELTLEDEFQDLHLNLPVLEMLRLILLRIP